ncbi:DUF1403 family protein [Pseudaminobacter sp. NGMCC 1.201702]|uniref:DUF1403 family protein n=1 Tax=Pseudaminobacter sp. NGMCC 1.201702 TaxID=3391825 RepID=UPI0039F0E7B6
MATAVPSSFSTPQLPVVPAWALRQPSAADPAAAGFMAGAALTALDHLVRAEPPGAWRQRLALNSAVCACRLAGRGEDQAALRDVWHLRRADDFTTLGPAGAIYGVWRQLASWPTSKAVDAQALADIVDNLGLQWSEPLAAIPQELEKRRRSDDSKPGPFTAAAIVRHVVTADPQAELLAWWLADLGLAQSLRWPKPVPLLMGQVFSPAFRAGGGRRNRIRPGEEEFDQAVCLALAQGAAEACRLGGEISRRAGRLAQVVPKLRAKGAGTVIERLLDDDAVPGTLTTKSLSRFAARRLFTRLEAFGAVRELSGRASFRLYGL